MRVCIVFITDINFRKNNNKTLISQNYVLRLNYLPDISRTEHPINKFIHPAETIDDIYVSKTASHIKVKVTNTGQKAGKDVVQIYIKAPRKGLDKPERELKGFAKTPLLAPGETCEVTIFISKESLASYDESAKSWITEKGRYTFIAAQNSLDNSRRKKVTVK